MKQAKKPVDYLKEAISIAGGQTALAKLIGRRQSTIHTMLHRDKKVSAIVALAIEEALDYQVTKEQLCPDIFKNKSKNGPNTH